jgi:formylglycine-generating enzyme required for sulfatase activity
MNDAAALTRGCPPRWANSWGEDNLGRFVGVVLGEFEYRMRWAPPGEFMMGSPEGEEGRFAGEGPQHRVTISQGFWLGETPVTQAFWEAVTGENPSHFKDPDRPVEQVSWNDCQRFCAALEALTPGLGLRLPSEAEWEYACRAGTTGPTYAGAGPQAQDRVAWWSSNSKEQTQPVMLKQPNAWALYDMLGNVYEWCSDGMRTYSSKPAVDPRGPVAGDPRVRRGGSWYSLARSVRAAYRNRDAPDFRYHVLGLRLARGQE